MKLLRLFCALALFGTAATAASFAQQLGIFDGHSDVGAVSKPGTVEFQPANKTYVITGSGENIWVSPDAFHFVWKKVTGDFALTADVAFVGAGGNPHRKAVLMVRQSLDADSRYVDIALHGEGLTSMQFREDTGGPTREIQSSVEHPERLRLVKRGDYFYMALGSGSALRISGGSPRIHFDGAFYVGLGVCAHDNTRVEKASFANVEFSDRTASSAATPVMFSALETLAVGNDARKAVYVTRDHIEAPNWTRDGSAFIFNSGGRIYRLAVGAATPSVIDTGTAVQCNNDHGISPDGKTLVISDQSQDQQHGSLIYRVPIAGGVPKRITQNAPSYWHGWSPDGNTLAFVGQRNGEFDVYSIPAQGGQETRLTTAKGLDDGPEYSPDGKYIYFNSERTGHMQIWRMSPAGTNQEQVTFDKLNDWFPHFSPSGDRIVFLSYESDVAGHPANKDVVLRMMTLADKKISVLARLFGGQGTINVPSWSPNGTQFAFVSYTLVDPEDAGLER